MSAKMRRRAMLPAASSSIAWMYFEEVDARAVAEIVHAGGTRYFAPGVGHALVRVGAVEAAVRAAHHVVGAVEAPALVAVHYRLDLAAGADAHDAPAVAFAQDQAPLQVEGCAVAAGGFANELRRAAGCHAVEPVAAEVDEVPVAVRVPERAFGEDEAGREALGFGRLQDVGQVVRGGHAALFFA
ncbi:MAG: hypothetical protein HYV99_03990 [Betaproteobacteria bacterium]|nr:hypothetical protein [Betaproteobacteria bacterium]